MLQTKHARPISHARGGEGSVLKNQSELRNAAASATANLAAWETDRGVTSSNPVIQHSWNAPEQGIKQGMEKLQ